MSNTHRPTQAAYLLDPARLAAVRATGLTPDLPSSVLDHLTRVAARVVGAPVSLVSLVDDERQAFFGLTGLGGWAGEARETPLTHSFCQHVVTSRSDLVVEDARTHPIVRGNLAIPDLGVEAYAGVPLTTSGGDTVGALCAIDSSPRDWTPEQVESLRDLAHAVVAELELRTALVAVDAARQEAVNANHAKSDFLARMSHELRTPLNSIIGFSQQLIKRATVSADTPALMFLERVHRNGLGLLTLINDILDLSKIEAGKIELEVAPTDLAPVLHDVAAMLEPQVQPGVRLVVDCPHAPRLTTDKVRLQQVLINLVGNALKFTTIGTVRVTAMQDAPTPGRVTIRVTDTGPGIPADRLDAIFTPFEQADATVTRTHGGTGLGLAISRSLCALLGGTLVVDSEVGVGSTFVVELPVEPPQSSPLARDAEGVAHPTAQR